MQQTVLDLKAGDVIISIDGATSQKTWSEINSRLFLKGIPNSIFSC